MKNWNLFFRRTHLYLGMVLLPWMVMYAVSTVVFNHIDWFRSPGAERRWDQLWEKEYAADIPATDEGLRATVRRILDEHGFKGPFGVQRHGHQLTIAVPNLLNPSRLIYNSGTRTLRAETRTNTGSEVLLRLHTRTGYGRGAFLNNLWAFIVDAFCATTLIWIVTGLYLWWKLPATRGWGFAALGGGFATIVVLLLTV